MHSDDSATIYTDGACSNNGRSEDAKAGIGVFWPNKESNNISEPLDGRQTNQRAEIVAATEGIAQAKSMGYDRVTVKTDSRYVKLAAESWIPKWEREGWTRRVVNLDDFKRLQNVMDGIKVNFEKIPRELNSADRLARDGAKKTISLCRKFIH